MDQKQRNNIQKKVRARRKFYQHLIIFGSVASLFLVLNLITGFRFRFLFIPMIGWGFGVAIHFFTTIGSDRFAVFDDDWEEKEIQKEMNRIEDDDPLDLDDLPEKNPEKLKENKWDDSDIV